MNFLMPLSQLSNVVHHYHQIKNTGSQITPRVFPPLFKYLANFRSSKLGTSIHADVIKMGFDSDTSTCNSVISFYSKCNMMSSALRFFNKMECKDSVSWNALIHGLLSLEEYELGLSLFMEARASNFEPNVSCLILVVQACWKLEAIDEGQNIHGFITKSGFSIVASVQNSLLNMYVKFLNLNYAQKLFDEMCERDVISWSSLISGYTQCGNATNALRLFRSMYVEPGIEMDGLAAVCVLQACANAGDIDNGRSLHAHLIRKGFEEDVFVENSLIDMYSKCIDIDSALVVFDHISSTNIVSWNSIITGLIGNEKCVEALQLFGSMQKTGVEGDEVTMVNLLHACKRLELPLHCRCIHGVVIRGWLSNDFVLNSLLDSYTKCGLMELAMKLFDTMERKDVISWSTMIAGFAHCGNASESIAFFREMQFARELPNSVTILSLIEACVISAELKLSKTVHGLSIRNDLGQDLTIGTSLIDMYAKCGDLISSKKVFDEMPSKNIHSWNAMIGALGMNGRGKEALALLHEMHHHDMKPNSVTMVSILSSCSHCGLVQDGLACFQRMLKVPSLQPSLEHYSCVIDMLARSGDLKGALEVMKKMPGDVEPSPVAWGALMSGCRSHRNFELGQIVASRVVELEPTNSAGYLMSSSMFASGGGSEGLASMRRLMKERRLKMVSGYSLVHVEGRGHKFVAWDESHLEKEGIYVMVEFLHYCMKKVEGND